MLKASHLALTAVICALGFSSGARAVPSPNVVISQVYGGGGNSGATYTHDFIELYNRSAETVLLTGWSVQYAPATAGTYSVTPLNGIIPAGAHYLIQQDDGAGGTTPLPFPNAIGTINLATGAGRVAVVSNLTTLSGNDVDNTPGVFDFVGYGSAAIDFETAPTATATNTTAVIRLAAGAIDTDNNSTDFVTGAPNPRNFIPEPASLTLLAAAAMCMTARRNDRRNGRR